uniref:Uncharacterized protein n=1 Tax=Helianthus annuus TaxID=4232 RepID=A0A251VI97_HELAN
MSFSIGGICIWPSWLMWQFSLGGKLHFGSQYTNKITLDTGSDYIRFGYMGFQ